MANSPLDKGKTMFIDERLYKKIKTAINNYFLTIEGLDVSKLAMTRPLTFKKLIIFIESEDKDIQVNPKFLITLYRGDKTNKTAKTEIIEAICKTLKINEDNEQEYISLILEFKKLCESDVTVREFAGEYKLFLGGRKQPSIYDKVYEDHLKIFENGITKKFNPYSKKTSWGYCLVRDNKTLEVLSFDIKKNKVIGIGSLMVFKINEYKKLSEFFPGINLSFDGETMPIIYHALLASNFSINKKNKIVEKYFNDIGKNLRMECPDLSDTEKLRQFFDK